jgi:hypothetical protein
VRTGGEKRQEISIAERVTLIHAYTLYTHARRVLQAAAKTIHLCHAPQLHNQFSIRLQTRKNRARSRRLY